MRKFLSFLGGFWGLVAETRLGPGLVFSVSVVLHSRRTKGHTTHMWFVVCMLSVFVFIGKDISRGADVFVHLARMTHGSKSPSLVIM